MKPKEPLVIHIDVSWRSLVVLGLLAGVLAFGYSAARAQDGAPQDINSVADAAADLSAQPSEAPAAPQAPQCADGDVPTVNSECVQADAIGAGPLSATGANEIAAVGTGSRHVYLTSTNYWANQALTACASGYHMASLWEILDVSNLIYDSSHPSAYNKTDSGYGPPSGWFGWVRTGYDSSGLNAAGTGNCLNWTSTVVGNFGVSVALSTAWETAPGEMLAWEAASLPCSYVGPVWCVRN